MFDINLFDFLATLSIGTFSVVAILYIIYLGYRYLDIRKNNSVVFISYLKNVLKTELKQTGYSIFALIAVYTLGILTQDFTDHLSDSETTRNPLVNFFKNINVIDRESELRYFTLVKDDQKLTGLGIDVFSNKRLFNESLENDTTYFNTSDVKTYWKTNGKRLSKDLSFKKYINGKYYIAKNWCYLKSGAIRDELSEIQIRIDLARSLAIISILTLVIIVLLYMVYLTVELSKKKTRRFKVLIVSYQPAKKTSFVKSKFHPLKPIVLLLVTYMVSNLCYSVAENNFNERAFGYYRSHFQFINEK